MIRYFSFFATILLMLGIFFAIKYKAREVECFDRCAFKHDLVLAQANTIYNISLVDPEQAPDDIKESVMRGYKIMMNTPLHAGKYAKNQLSCTNCHFLAGDTLGRKNGGIPLVGVVQVYPRYSERDKKTITLEDRITNCFQRSMNGIAPPKDDPIMKDLIAYFKWISKETAHLKEIPWLGLKFLKSDHEGDPENGKKLYLANCAMCHKENGEGGGVLLQEKGKTIPPLWGNQSFNTGAGMNREGMLAAFIYCNMPYVDATLSEEDAIDIASFIVKQPRPKFVPPPK